MEDFSTRRLGESSELLTFGSAAENRAIARAMAVQAQRTLHIFTADLDPQIYDNGEFMEAAARMARSHDRARIFILAQDAGPSVRSGHRLIELAQRLSSRVEIRQPVPEYSDITESFMVADGIGYIRRLQPACYEGEASFHNPLTARNLVDRFEEVWERAHADPQLRRLHI